MIKYNKNVVIVNGNRIELQSDIKTVVEFENLYILLLITDILYPNNVIALDSNGNEIWKINDILKIEEPSGNSAIKKIDETTFAVISSVGIMYEINVKTLKVNKTMFMR